jgi:hypothetical protein
MLERPRHSWPIDRPSPLCAKSVRNGETNARIDFEQPGDTCFSI